MKHGCNLTAEVIEKKSHRSNLTQGGIEIKSKVSVTWLATEEIKFLYLKDFVEKNYNFEKRNDDESGIILDKIKKQITIIDDVSHPSTSSRDVQMSAEEAEEVLEIQQLDQDSKTKIFLLLWKLIDFVVYFKLIDFVVYFKLMD